MTVPLDAIMVFHNAFRRDMEAIDAAALKYTRGNPDMETDIERFHFFNEVLVWHARGEELAIFPALEKVVPSVAEAYERDHRGLDAANDALNVAFSAKDSVGTARATAAFKFHLDIHLGKEDAHLYRLVRERVSASDQEKAIGVMAGNVPQERFPEVIAWLFSLVDNEDRETMTRIWQMMMTPAVFSDVSRLIQDATGHDWAELKRRIPSLT